MNAFASYAERAAPRERAPSALDKKLAEKQRLSRAYKVSRRKQRAETFEMEPRLRDFMRYVGRIQEGDGDALIAAIAESWLPAAPFPVRYLALEIVQRRCDRLNRRNGFAELDDPIFDQPLSVWQRAHALLIPGGRG